MGRKMASLLAALAILSGFYGGVETADAADGSKTCIMLKFEDDTRFDKVDTAGTLSDLIMEKLINSGSFSFKETKPLDKNMEKALYSERVAEFRNARTAINSGNYNVLFEGAGFAENKAQSIASARLGQIVSPAITQVIGTENNADYLIQGTIINLGTGNWVDPEWAIASMAKSYFAPGLGMALGPASTLLNVDTKKTGIGVQADVRVIKASTGEVIWQERLTGRDTQTKYKLGGMISIGSDKVNNEMYFKAVNDAAQIIADTLIGAANEGKLFVK